MLEKQEQKFVDRRAEKAAIRRDLEKHVADYLARGGKIKHLKFGETTQDIDMHEVTFRTRVENDAAKTGTGKEKNRQSIIQQISEGKPINLFEEE